MEPAEWKVHVLTEQTDNIRNYLKKYWGYTTRMIDEVMKTGKTPHRAEYLDDGTRVEDDAISPQHYQQGNIQVLDFINDQKFTYLEGNIVKYISRYKTKNGLEDLEKAQYYLNELIKLVADEDDRIADQIDEEILCG